MAVAVDNVIQFRACEALPFLVSPADQLSPEDVARIEALRPIAQEAQLYSRADLEAACRLIAADRRATFRGYGLALFGALSEFASRRMTFFAPGTLEFSDCEIWLARLLRAFEHMDTAEGRALIAWRVRPLGHRRVRFLVGGLADALIADRGAREDVAS